MGSGNYTIMFDPDYMELLGVLTPTAGQIREMLKPGEALTQDRLARWLSISRTTVVAAYDALRESGWLESRSQAS